MLTRYLILIINKYIKIFSLDFVSKNNSETIYFQANFNSSYAEMDIIKALLPKSVFLLFNPYEVVCLCEGWGGGEEGVF